MAKQKPVYTTELRHRGEYYHEPQLCSQSCDLGLMYVLHHFYYMPAVPSRIWIEWYAKPTPGVVTVTLDPDDVWGSRLGRIRSGKRTHDCPYGAWRVLPDEVVKRHRTLYARVYYQE